MGRVLVELTGPHTICCTTMMVSDPPDGLGRREGVAVWNDTSSNLIPLLCPATVPPNGMVKTATATAVKAKVQATPAHGEEEYTTSRRSNIQSVPVLSLQYPAAPALPRVLTYPPPSPRFAPLVVPRKRRLQTLAVFGWTTALPLLLGLFFVLWYVSRPRTLSLRLEQLPELPRWYSREVVKRDQQLTMPLRSSSIPIFWPLIVPYLIWIFLIDQGPSQGGRANQRIRKSRFWVWFAGYYPVRCVTLIPDS